jgi:hypothetical protein
MTDPPRNPNSEMGHVEIDLNLTKIRETVHKLLWLAPPDQRAIAINRDPIPIGELCSRRVERIVAGLSVITPVILRETELNLIRVVARCKAASSTGKTDLKVIICSRPWSRQRHKLSRQIRTAKRCEITPITLRLITLSCIPVADLELVQRNACAPTIDQNKVRRNRLTARSCCARHILSLYCDRPRSCRCGRNGSGSSSCCRCRHSRRGRSSGGVCSG